MSYWYKKSIDETLSTLKVEANQGLSSQEVLDRLQKYGLNMIEEVDGKKWYHLVFEQFTNVMVVILMIAMIVSFAVGERIDAAAIGVIVIINAIVGFIQEFKAEKAIEALRNLTAPNAVVIRNGEIQSIAAKNLVPGDIVIIEEGKFVPADARLLEEAELQTNESSLTGESNPIEKHLKPITKDCSIGDQKNMVFMGTTITKGHGKAVVVSTGMQTGFGSIANMVQTEQSGKTPLQIKLDKLSKYLAMIVIFIILLLFVSAVISGRDITEMLLLSITLAVSVIPEGLPTVITLTLAIAVQKMSKQNAIVSKLPAAETLGSTSVICTDKTGTLTQNQMTVQKVYVNDTEIDVSGVGYDPIGNFAVGSKKFAVKKSQEFLMLAKCAALCNNSQLIDDNGYSILGDPTEGCLLTMVQKSGLKILGRDNPRIKELVFDSNRKRMSTVNQIDGKQVLLTKGAPDSIFKICNRILEDGKIRKITKSDLAKLDEINEKYASEAYRVLAFAYKESGDEEADMIFVGMVGIIDPPRPEVKSAIELCKKAHISVVMITGDHALTAKSVGKKIGLISDKNKVLTGDELAAMTDFELEKVVEEIKIFARVNPEHKVRILKALQAKDYIVAMTGDGVNDAPALKSADIGVAMGITGTDVSKEASKMILTDDNFATIVKAVENGRIVYANIKKFVRFLLSANFGEILIVATIVLLGYPSPILPLQILWINLLTDALPAVALGFDGAEKGLMQQKPRSQKEGILKELIGIALFAGAVATVVCLFVYFKYLDQLPIDHVRSLVFTTIVMFELIVVFSLRSEKDFFWKKMFSNWYLVIAVLLSFAAQIAALYTPSLQNILETVPLGLNDWIIILTASLIGFTVVELWKIFRIRPGSF